MSAAAGATFSDSVTMAGWPQLVGGVGSGKQQQAKQGRALQQRSVFRLQRGTEIIDGLLNGEEAVGRTT